MSGKMNWSKIERERKMAYMPSPRSESATKRQLNYIAFLARKKGQLLPKPPRTKHGAGQIIDRLLGLPDAEQPLESRLIESDDKPANPTAELVAELREHHPQLTPMAANSLINLFSIINPIGCAFTVDTLLNEGGPADRDELIVHLLRRFLEEFSDISSE